MKTISTSDCPPPAGHYSQGMVHDGLVYVSGIGPIGCTYSNVKIMVSRTLIFSKENSS